MCMYMFHMHRLTLMQTFGEMIALLRTVIVFIDHFIRERGRSLIFPPYNSCLQSLI